MSVESGVAAPPSKEGFQPIAVPPPGKSPMLFWLRCVVDLQLATIATRLRPSLAAVEGAVLDVGAGQSPWRDWLPATARYQGIDVGYAAEFGMAPARPDIIYYDGTLMPLGDRLYDCVLCIEVLEHAADPELLLNEIWRVMKPGGSLLLTVPWSARVHHLPHDYHRFTRFRLMEMFGHIGFHGVEIHDRGTDVGTIANKLTLLTIRLLRPPAHARQFPHLAWRLPLGLLCGVIAACFIGAAHLSFAMATGMAEDPLGYFVKARRPESL